jgi:hypothetical protein
MHQNFSMCYCIAHTGTVVFVVYYCIELLIRNLVCFEYLVLIAYTVIVNHILFQEIQTNPDNII